MYKISIFEQNCIRMVSLCSLVFCSVFMCVSAQDENMCPDLHPPTTDLSQVMGLFFAVEIVQHRDEPRNRGVTVVDSCPKVQLTMSGDRFPFIKLLWDEQAGHVQYHFTLPDEHNQGYWMSAGSQNGTMLQRPYKQFAGTVHVMKVAHNYIVLTFCSPNSDFYSVLLSRDQKLSRGEIRGVHNMLLSKNLKEIGIKKACRDGATALSSSIALILTVITTLFVMH